jgi:asparagine synthase (glutamine-hydrolysing)
LPLKIKGRKFSYNVSLPWNERYVDSLSFLPVLERDVPLLSDGFREILRRCDAPGDALQRYFTDSPTKDPLSQLLYVDTKTYLVGDILTKVDRMSMLNSLEVRVPLLDHQLVEWAAGLSSDWKLRGRRQKYILAKLAERVGVPRDALYRRKQGFALPLSHWMRHELKEMLSVLLEPRSLQRGYFQPAAVRKLMNDHQESGRDLSDQLWRMLIFELWHRNFLEKCVSPSAPYLSNAISCAQPSNPVLTSAPAGK